VGFGLLYQLIPLLSTSNQLLPVLHLEHLQIFEDSIDPSTLGSSCSPFPKWFPVGYILNVLSWKIYIYIHKHTHTHTHTYIYIFTRWLKYDRDYLCVNKSQFVPVIFETPCI
jgi:hypothetical protein